LDYFLESSICPISQASNLFFISRPPWRGRERSSGGRAITASWIAASIIGMLSTDLSAHSHQRSKERRANFKRVLFQRQFADKLHDAIFDDIGFNADPQYLRIQAL
jgi:hypothetical protein